MKTFATSIDQDLHIWERKEIIWYRDITAPIIKAVGLFALLMTIIMYLCEKHNMLGPSVVHLEKGWVGQRRL